MALDDDASSEWSVRAHSAGTSARRGSGLVFGPVRASAHPRSSIYCTAVARLKLRVNARGGPRNRSCVRASDVPEHLQLTYTCACDGSSGPGGWGAAGAYKPGLHGAEGLIVTGHFRKTRTEALVPSGRQKASRWRQRLLRFQLKKKRLNVCLHRDPKAFAWILLSLFVDGIQ